MVVLDGLWTSWWRVWRAAGTSPHMQRLICLWSDTSAHSLFRSELSELASDFLVRIQPWRCSAHEEISFGTPRTSPGSQQQRQWLGECFGQWCGQAKVANLWGTCNKILQGRESRHWRLREARGRERALGQEERPLGERSAARVLSSA